jgi:hypothetical protein
MVHPIVPEINKHDPMGSQEALVSLSACYSHNLNQNLVQFLVLYPTAGVNCFVTGWYVNLSTPIHLSSTDDISRTHIYPSPLSSSVTRFTNDFYFEESASEVDKEEFYRWSREVDQEDWELCFKTQKNLNGGVYSSGTLHPVQENGVLRKSYFILRCQLRSSLTDHTDYQNLTKKLVMEHAAKEMIVERAIDPLVRAN